MRIFRGDIGTGRADIALAHFKSGKETIQFGRISISNYPSGGVEVNVWSNWQASNISRKAAEEELSAGVQEFFSLLEDWSDLAELGVDDSAAVFLSDDYGMGSVQICRLLADGGIEWLWSPEA